MSIPAQLKLHVSAQVGICVASGQTLAQALGYPPREIHLSDYEFENLSDEALHARFQEQDKFYLVDGGSCWSRGLYCARPPEWVGDACDKN